MQRWSSLTLLLVTFLLVTWVTPTLAHADEPEVEASHAAPVVPGPAHAVEPPSEPEASHRADSHLASLGFRVVAGTSRAYRSNTWVFGFGATSELHLGLGFEVGVGAAVLLGEVSEVFPFEVFLRKSFRLAPRVLFYLQAGPILALVHEAGHDVLPLFGGTFAGGFTLWLDEGFGILIEAAYQLIAEDELVHDIEGAVGVAIRL